MRKKFRQNAVGAKNPILSVMLRKTTGPR